MCKINSKLAAALRLTLTLMVSAIVVVACTLSLRAQTETRRDYGRVDAQASVALGLQKDAVTCSTKCERGNQEIKLQAKGDKYGTNKLHDSSSRPE